MNTLFSRKKKSDIEAFLQREERRRQQRLEAFAIEALELGLAFEEGEKSTDPEQSDEQPALTPTGSDPQ